MNKPAAALTVPSYANLQNPILELVIAILITRNGENNIQVSISVAPSQKNVIHMPFVVCCRVSGECLFIVAM